MQIFKKVMDINNVTKLTIYDNVTTEKLTTYNTIIVNTNAI